MKKQKLLVALVAVFILCGVTAHGYSAIPNSWQSCPLLNPSLGLGLG